MLKTVVSSLLAVSACFGAAATARAASANDVDLELILAVDVSRSMDYDEQRVQRDGYVQAIRDPQFIQEIQSGAYGRIAVAYMEWSSSYYQNVLVPWTIIASKDDAAAFANALAAAPITTDSRTSISGALLYAQDYFHKAPAESDRLTIDVSGDGADNDGAALTPVRDKLVANGITINGLPILIRPSNLFGPAGFIPLDDYYKACVTGGPSSFVIPVQTTAGFADAIRRKLILEVASVPSPIVPAATLAQSSPKVDCAAADLQGNGGFGGDGFAPPFINR